MSDKLFDALNCGLKAMGYKIEHSFHGVDSNESTNKHGDCYLPISRESIYEIAECIVDVATNYTPEDVTYVNHSFDKSKDHIHLDWQEPLTLDINRHLYSAKLTATRYPQYKKVSGFGLANVEAKDKDNE